MKECTHKAIKEIRDFMLRDLARRFPIEERPQLSKDIKYTANICLKQKEDSETFEHTFRRIFGDLESMQRFKLNGEFPFDINDYLC